MLKAKLHAPTINKNIIRRERLMVKLRYAQECKLTLVTAPAGYGKTTAVLDWLGKCGLPLAWVSLESRDNDNMTFWQYVFTSLEGIACGIRQDTEYVFSSQELMKANIHINILIDRLSEVTYDFLLVLDDLHLISDLSILAGLFYLVDFMPAKMHMVFISRKEPEIDLSRFRLKWQAHRITEDDLRFDGEEIARFYQARGIALQAGELDQVELCTEGWAAALVAVTLAMEEGSGHSAIEALSRSGRDIEQYLRDEVISSWKSEKQSFAMKTCILGTLTETLCDAVTGDGNGCGMLKEIGGKSGFLVALDDSRQKYRYHNLFQSFLYRLLTETSPEEIPVLHARAAHWFRGHGFIPEAIEHFLSGGAFREAFELIEHQIDHLIHKNDFGRLLTWIKCLPDAYRDNSFKIAVIYALYYAETGRYDLSWQWVEQMKSLKEKYQSVSYPERNSDSRRICFLVEANLLVREGSDRFLSLLVSASEENRDKGFKMPAYNDFNMADIYFYRCPINKIAKLFAEMPAQYNRMTESYRAMISRNPGYAPLGIGEYLYESNRLEEALPYLLKAAEEAREANCPGALIPAMVDIARIKRAGGDISGAFLVLEECKKQLQGSGKSHWNYLISAFCCKLYIDTGYSDKVREWFYSSKLNIFTELNKIREFELMILSRALISMDRMQDAQLLLQRLLSFTGDNKRLHSRVEVLNLLALVEFENHHALSAFRYMDESLDIGMQEGYVRSYLDELAPMARILRAYIKSRRKPDEEHRRKEHKTFAGNLLKQMPNSLLPTLEAHGEVAAGMEDKVLEQLTPQEKKVLMLIVNAATNKEISDKLGISLRTVKTHTGNIYGKLGLKNRTQCIKLVRELGLYNRQPLI